MGGEEGREVKRKEVVKGMERAKKEEGERRGRTGEGRKRGGGVETVVRMAGAWNGNFRGLLGGTQREEGRLKRKQKWRKNV